MRKYSRLASVEEKKNIKKTYRYIFLSIASLVFLVIFGLPTLIKFAGFVGDITEADRPIEINDITPPAPPQFDDIPEYTNRESVEVTGSSESGARISINSNGDSSEVVANNEGRFTFVFNLNKGENTISAISKDSSGNVSSETKIYMTIFDDISPKVDVSSPKDNDSFFGNQQRQISVQGTVNEKTDLTINGRFVELKDDGTFVFSTTLNDGQNTFEIKAVDPAGNEATSTLSVNFTP